jgi:hypothetical protein
MGTKRELRPQGCPTREARAAQDQGPCRATRAPVETRSGRRQRATLTQDGRSCGARGRSTGWAGYARPVLTSVQPRCNRANDAQLPSPTLALGHPLLLDRLEPLPDLAELERQRVWGISDGRADDDMALHAVCEPEHDPAKCNTHRFAATLLLANRALLQCPLLIGVAESNTGATAESPRHVAPRPAITRSEGPRYGRVGRVRPAPATAHAGHKKRGGRSRPAGLA